MLLKWNRPQHRAVGSVEAVGDVGGQFVCVQGARRRDSGRAGTVASVASGSVTPVTPEPAKTRVPSNVLAEQRDRREA